MIKYFGIIFISSASLYGAYLSILHTRKKSETISDMLDLIKYIRDSIVIFNLPLPEIYENCKIEGLSELTRLLKNEKWEIALKAAKISEYIDTETEKAIIKLGGVLGKMPIEEQGAECDYVIEILKTKTNEANELLPKKARVMSSLFVLGGIGIIIMVI